MAWAKPICLVVGDAHVNSSFDADVLAAIYDDAAVFDDPCGTIRTPRGIVAGFDLIHKVFDVNAEPTATWSLHPPSVGSVGGALVLSEDAVGDAGEGDLTVIPAQARLEQKATYALRIMSTIRFTLASTIVIEFDAAQKVVRHEDRWWGRPVTLNIAHAALKEWHGRMFVWLFARP